MFPAALVITLIAQTYTGLNVYNEFLSDHGQPPVDIINYLFSGLFLQSTFENWESEFFQMGLFIWFTVFLRQIGSSESKKISGKEELDRAPKNHPKAPWPVKKGGIILTIYKHSLSLSLFTLFVISFIIHWYGSNKNYNEEQSLQGKPIENMLAYFT